MPISRTTRLDRIARGVCPVHPERHAVEGRPWCAACLEGQRRGQERWRRKKKAAPTVAGAPLPELREALQAVWEHLRAHEQMTAQAILTNAQRRGLPPVQRALLEDLIAQGRTRQTAASVTEAATPRVVHARVRQGSGARKDVARVRQAENNVTLKDG
jgi:hypothetical protein